MEDSKNNYFRRVALIPAAQRMRMQRSHTMGDKGGKKDKSKGEKQKIAKKEREDKKKRDKQPKKSP